MTRRESKDKAERAVSAMEGALVLSRMQRSKDPILRVA